MGMTYRDLFYKATRLIDKGEITLGEYDEMTKPLNREVEKEPCTEGDAISRKDAIEACLNGWNKDYKEIIKDIKQLPSVQPKTGWIPVSERAPKKGVEVLATTIWDEITIAERFSNNDWFIHEGNSNADMDEIKAWQPLPEPYKEG